MRFCSPSLSFCFVFSVECISTALMEQRVHAFCVRQTQHSRKFKIPGKEQSGCEVKNETRERTIRNAEDAFKDGNYFRFFSSRLSLFQSFGAFCFLFFLEYWFRRRRSCFLLVPSSSSLLCIRFSFLLFLFYVTFCIKFVSCSEKRNTFDGCPSHVHFYLNAKDDVGQASQMKIKVSFAIILLSILHHLVLRVDILILFTQHLPRFLLPPKNLEYEHKEIQRGVKSKNDWKTSFSFCLFGIDGAISSSFHLIQNIKCIILSFMKKNVFKTIHTFQTK